VNTKGKSSILQKLFLGSILIGSVALYPPQIHAVSIDDWQYGEEYTSEMVAPRPTVPTSPQKMPATPSNTPTAKDYAQTAAERKTKEQTIILIGISNVLIILATIYLIYRLVTIKKPKHPWAKKLLIVAIIVLLACVVISAGGLTTLPKGTSGTIDYSLSAIRAVTFSLFLNFYILALLVYTATHLVWAVVAKIKHNKHPVGRHLIRAFSLLIPYIIFVAIRTVLTNLTGAAIETSDITIGGSGTSGSSYKTVTSTGMGSNKRNLGGGVPAPTPSSFAMEDANIGFSTGGAKDINNFRENIENNYLPLPTDITYEGLFYDYYFDTGQTKECIELFCPTYSYAQTKDPFSQQFEEYITVGLNSGIKEKDFQRKKLNLVVVLDISGSMGSAFDRYYYDHMGNQHAWEEEGADYTKTKMQVANESVVAMLDHLQAGDRFGMVLFDDRAYLAKPLNLVEETDMRSIKDHILQIDDQGGTNMESGMQMGTALFDDYKSADRSVYENRIIFLTDAQPNTGAVSEYTLKGMAQNNAENKVYTTFVGVGVDFNSELVEFISKVKGANYYSVHSSTEFAYRMAEGFDYMVTPLVFDLNLHLESPDYDLDWVFGTPEADESTGEILKVNTLFPSDSEDGEVKGGIILVKLRKKSGATGRTIKLTASYVDRQEKSHRNVEEIVLPVFEDESYDNLGIRKSILLTRYANLLKNWTLEERKYERDPDRPINYTLVNEYDGIIVPPERYMTSRWERQSIPLRVSSQYASYFDRFKSYFEQEMQVLGDETLITEIEILKRLSAETDYDSVVVTPN
jgi:Ca-activated chloride channel homolog